MGPKARPEKLVTKYPSTLSNTPEERGFYLHCGGILKPGIEFYETQMTMSYYCPGKSEGIPVIVVPKCGCELFLVRLPVIFMVNNFTLHERHFPALRRIFFVCSLVCIGYFCSDILGQFYKPATLHLQTNLCIVLGSLFCCGKVTNCHVPI